MHLPQTTDMEVIARHLSDLSTPELQALAIELAGSLVPVRRREELLAGTIPVGEPMQRALTFAQLGLLSDELQRRGEQPPEQFVLAYKRWLEALTSAPPREPGKSNTSSEASKGAGGEAAL